jgi:hypothetical protein
VDKSFQFLVALRNPLDVFGTAFSFGRELESSTEVMDCHAIGHVFAKPFKLLEKTRRASL